MKRREFLQRSAVGASAGLVSRGTILAVDKKPAAAVPSGPDPVLVVIFLRGGHDQLNTFVPYTDKTYYNIRPTIAVPKDKVIKLNDEWGIHPAMGPLKQAYDEGKFAAIINTGSPHSTRSHFDAQDFMEFGAPGDRTVHNGWLNRYLAATADQQGFRSDAMLRALAMQELLPRSLRGDFPVVAMPANLAEVNEVLDLFEEFYTANDQDRRSELIDKLNREQAKAGSKKRIAGGMGVDPVMASGRDTIQGLRRLRKIIYGDQNAYGSSRAQNEPGAFQEYPETWFAGRLKMLAKVIKANVGMQVAATDINGWDHHIGMGSTDGTLNRMLTFLSEGLDAFMKDLGSDLDRTTVLVCTEFGRVCKENGNDGADHGHGGAMWLLGGNVRGGKVYGQWKGLETKSLNDGRDLPVTTDFRAVFAEVLQQHMRFEVPAEFFPKYTLPTEKIGLFA